MTKNDAIRELIIEARKERLTKAGLKKLDRIGVALGLDSLEQIQMERDFEYRRADGSLLELKK